MQEIPIPFLFQNVCPFELRNVAVVNDKRIDVPIYRKFFILRVMPFIKIFCASNAYLAIHYVHLCQVIGEHEECELAYFFLYYKMGKGILHGVVIFKNCGRKQNLKKNSGTSCVNGWVGLCMCVCVIDCLWIYFL